MKFDQHCLGLTIVYHHAMSFQKNCHKADQKNKVAHFFPKLSLVQKDIFFGKLANMTNAYYTSS